jgi:uncharacterized protein YndB with AHSA1/START domain
MVSADERRHLEGASIRGLGHGKTLAMSSEPPILIRVARRFDAAPEQVFDAWLEPRLARRFLFATPAGQMLRADIDARVGGGFDVTERRNGQDAEHIGTYLEIDRPRRLVFDFHTDRTSPEPSRVSIDFVPHGDGCELTLTHEVDPRWAAFRERTQAGWSMILESLDKVLGAQADRR